MDIHMTGLYTRLVTYARLHILTLVISFYHDTSYILFITLLLIFEYPVIFYFRLSCCYWLHCFYAREPFPLHTHTQTHTLIRSLLTTLDCTSRYWMSYALVQVFLELVRFARSWSFSLFVLVLLSLLSFCYFLILDIYQIQSLFQFFIYVISSVDIYMSYCSDIDYRSRFLYNLFRLL